MTTNIQFTNFAATTLASGCTNTDTTLTLTSGSAFPTLTGSKYFYGTLVDVATGTVKEIVKVTARSGGTLTVVRAQDNTGVVAGTQGYAYLANDRFELRSVAASEQTAVRTDEVIIASSKTLSVSNSLTLAGTDSTTMTFPSTSATIARTDAANTFTGAQTLSTTTDSTSTATGTLIIAGGVGIAKNLYVGQNISNGYTTTATAAGTTTLTVASTYAQFFTGSTTQTVVLPVTSTLQLGFAYRIVNESTGNVTIQSSGANTILVLGPSSEALLTCILTSGTTAASWEVAAQGYKGIPINSQSAAYTTVLSDAGKTILHPAADTTARTFTIDSNANVPYPIGTAITFVNETLGGIITIAITSDTLLLAGAGTTGSRSLAASNIATAVKITTTKWIISGSSGLT